MAWACWVKHCIETELANLIHDFSCVRAEKIRTDIIREHTEEIKGKEGSMYLEEGIMEQVRNIPELRMRLLTDDERREAREEGREEGEKRREDNILRTLIINALKQSKRQTIRRILFHPPM